MTGDETARVKDAENSAASLMIRALQESDYVWDTHVDETQPFPIVHCSLDCKLHLKLSLTVQTHLTVTTLELYSPQPSPKLVFRFQWWLWHAQIERCWGENMVNWWGQSYTQDWCSYLICNRQTILREQLWIVVGNCCVSCMSAWVLGV